MAAPASLLQVDEPASWAHITVHTLPRVFFLPQSYFLQGNLFWFILSNLYILLSSIALAPAYSSSALLYVYKIIYVKVLAGCLAPGRPTNKGWCSSILCMF